MLNSFSALLEFPRSPETNKPIIFSYVQGLTPQNLQVLFVQDRNNTILELKSQPFEKNKAESNDYYHRNGTGLFG
jgi:hypothetical protein